MILNNILQIYFIAATILSFENLPDVFTACGKRAAKWDKLKIEDKIHDIAYRCIRTNTQRTTRRLTNKTAKDKKDEKIAGEEGDASVEKNVVVLSDGTVIEEVTS